MNIDANPFNLHHRIECALNNLANKDPDIANRMSWHRTRVTMSSRLRRTAGRCTYWRDTGDMHIEFSEALFNIMSEEDMNQTVIHELAHAICFRLSLDNGHGEYFKCMCELMGGPSDRFIKLKDDTIKRNLVKRWVVVRATDASKLFLRTRKKAARKMYRDEVLLGVIQVDRNKKLIKWVETKFDQIRTVNPLSKDGYELAV